MSVVHALEELQLEVGRTWLASDYPRDMRGDDAQFRHAHLHATKALGKIAALIDHADHERLKDAEAIGLREELPKLLADLLRCAAKMASMAPMGQVNLGLSYSNRASQLAERWGH